MGRETGDQVTLSALPLCLAGDPAAAHRSPPGCAGWGGVGLRLGGRVGDEFTSGTRAPGGLLGALPSPLPPEGTSDQGPVWGQCVGGGGAGSDGSPQPCPGALAGPGGGILAQKLLESEAHGSLGFRTPGPHFPGAWRRRDLQSSPLPPWERGQEGQEFACPPPTRPSPLPTAETHVLGAAPARALPSVSPGAGPGAGSGVQLPSPTHGQLETWAPCLPYPPQGHKPLRHRQAAAHCHQ